VPDEGLVTKSTEGSNYPTKRFLNQVDKQKRFYQSHMGQNAYKTPYVYNVEHDDDITSFTMEMIEGVDPIEYLMGCNDSGFISLCKLITRFVNDELQESRFAKVSRELFDDKFTSVIDNIKNNSIVPSQNVAFINALWIQSFRPEEDEVLCPIGPNHGDLTLSNMILTTDSLTFLDFMETYLDSPMQDIVKLRQDTKHHWILLRYPVKIANRTMVVSRLNAMDQYIALEWPTAQRCGYNTLQFLNLIRILPYATEERVVTWVLGELRRIV
jgi:hypothetical protein